jgi:hypothetical protein
MEIAIIVDQNLIKVIARQIFLSFIYIPEPLLEP